MEITLIGACEKISMELIVKLLAKTNNHLNLLDTNIKRIYEDSHRIKAVDVNPSNLHQLKKAIGKPDIVICTVSGTGLPAIAQNLVDLKIKRLIFITAVGVYNELVGEGEKFNIEREPAQIPNQKACEIIEAGSIDYTILRCGFFENSKDNYNITKKGEPVGNFTTTITSVENIVLDIIKNTDKYLNEDLAVTKD